MCTCVRYVTGYLMQRTPLMPRAQGIVAQFEVQASL